MNEKNQNSQSNDDKTNKDKITSPINYPNYRSQKGNIAIPSETNAEISRKWIETNKL